MADGAAKKMVLRSLHIPLDLDRTLRSLAFTRSVSKAEVMRGFIEDGLRQVAASGERTLAERVSGRAGEGVSAGSGEAVAKATPAQIKKSITPDGLISFLDGKSYKMLKRHLSAHGLDINAYRARYGLPADYPTVAANYAATKSDLAKALGLGQERRQQHRKAAERADETAKPERARGRAQAAG